jgi:hypothetical protein
VSGTVFIFPHSEKGISVWYGIDVLRIENKVLSLDLEIDLADITFVLLFLRYGVVHFSFVTQKETIWAVCVHRVILFRLLR